MDNDASKQPVNNPGQQQNVNISPPVPAISNQNPQNNIPQQPSSVDAPTKKHSLLKKVFIAIAILIALILATWYFLGPQIFVNTFLRMKFSENSRPELYTNVIPKKLAKTDLMQLKSYSHLGINFSVPWENETSNKTLESILQLAFEDDKKVILIIKNTQNAKNEFITGEPDKANDLELLFGKENLQTDYAFHKMIYNENPRDFSLFDSKKKAVTDGILVILKSAIVTDHIRGGIFSIETNQFNAIQLGDPKLSDGIEVQIWNKNDDSYSIVFRKDITEEEIDFILATINFN